MVRKVAQKSATGTQDLSKSTKNDDDHGLLNLAVAVIVLILKHIRSYGYTFRVRGL